jgi:PAS domain S-box-containing protein
MNHSEDQLRQIIDTIPVLAWSSRPDGFADFFNRRWLDYTGMALEQALGWGWKAAYHPNDLAQLASRWQAALAEAKPLETETRLRRSDGEYRWFLTRAFPLLDRDGRVLAWYGSGTDIHERKEAEERIKLTLHTVPGHLWTARPDGWVDFLTQRWMDYTGIPVEQSLGWSWEKVVHPDDNEPVLGKWRAAVEEKKPFEAEVRVKRFDGQYRWFLSRGLPLLDHTGNIVHWYGSEMDIHERKQAEDRVRQQELELRQILNFAPQHVAVLGPDGSGLYVNQAALDYFGLTLEAWRSGDPYRFFHPDDRERMTSEVHSKFLSGYPHETEARLLGKDGKYRWFLLRNVPLRDEAGSIVKWYGTATDIEERHRAEDALRRSEAYLAEAQRLSKTGNFGWSVSTGEIRWSDETFRIFQYDRTTKPTVELILKRVHPEDAAQVKQTIESASLNGKDFEHEYRLVMPDGAVKYLHVVAHASSDKSGRIEFVGAVMDVTERKRGEEALREAQADLARVSRVTTMGELTASLAHEIRQPIAAAATNANTCLRWLGRDCPDVEEARQAASRLVKDVTRAADIISSISLLFKKGALRRELVDVNELVREMIVLLRSEANRYSISIGTELAEGLPKVMADRVQLQQVFMNLMLNGIDAMKGTTDGRELTIKSEAGDAQVLISVSDTGAGLPPEQAEQIFRAFFTTKDHGTGMGLPISRSIIESHGGRLWAAGNSGHGATFQFTLPATAAPHI